MYQLASLPRLLLVGASPVRGGLFPLVRIQKITPINILRMEMHRGCKVMMTPFRN